MTPARVAGALGLAALLLGGTGHAAIADECLDEIEKTKAEVLSSNSAGGASSGGQSGGQQDGQQQAQGGQSGSETDQGSQGAAPIESWQGGSQTQNSSANSGVASIDPEAAKWFGIATELAKNGKSESCWQVLVQAQRILGVIPADAPLPEFE